MARTPVKTTSKGRSQATKKAVRATKTTSKGTNQKSVKRAVKQPVKASTANKKDLFSDVEEKPVQQEEIKEKVGDVILKNNPQGKSKATKEILYNQEQVKEMKKETARLLLNKIETLRERYTEEQLSTEQILKYIAGVYHIEIKYNKIQEELREEEK